MTWRKRFPFLLLAASAILTPPAEGAQPSQESPRLGILFAGPRTQPSIGTPALLQHLSELGWTEGRNLVIERRWPDHPDRLNALAAELVAMNVAIVVAPGPQATYAALAATKSVPIVTVGFTDPVAAGVVASLARPGGNLTGVIVADPQLWTGKRLQVLTETIPGLQRAAVLWDERLKQPTQQIDAEAGKLGLRLQHLAVSNPGGLEGAFRAARTSAAGAVLVMETPMLTFNGTLVAEQAIKYRLPVMTLFSQMVDYGALVSYGPNLNELYGVPRLPTFRWSSPALLN